MNEIAIWFAQEYSLVKRGNDNCEGTNIWYSNSNRLISINRGFKGVDGRVYDVDGNYLHDMPDNPVIKIHDGKLIYIF